MSTTSDDAPVVAGQNAHAAVLRAGLAALGLAIDPHTVAQLLSYLELLQRWNRLYNLTSVRDPMQMLHLHLLDCAAVVPALDRHLLASKARCLDVGSGAGLPGAVLAMLRPTWTVCCADTVAKKVSFVRQAAGELGLKNLSAVHARVETMPSQGTEVVLSRAFASLGDFTTCTRHHLGAEGVWMAMKGRVPDAEIAALPHEIEVFHVEHLQVPGVDAQRCLVWMRPR